MDQPEPKPKTYEPVVIREIPGKLPGSQRIYQFINGYGASVVDYSAWMGTTMGPKLWELAVIYFTKPSGYDEFKIVYDTDITENIECAISWEEVMELLQKIEALPLRRV